METMKSFFFFFFAGNHEEFLVMKLEREFMCQLSRVEL